MSDKKYNLVFTGEFIEGIDKQVIFEKLAKTFKTDVKKIEKLFSNGETIIKKETDKQTCIKMQEAVLFAGAKCEIEKIPSDGDEDEFLIFDEPTTNDEDSSYQDDSQENSTTKDSSTDPYATPSANIKTETENQADFIGPQKRPASNGGSWVFQAFSLFFKSPLIWIGIILVYIIISIAGNIIPIIGAIIMAILNPVFMGGIIKGTKELDTQDKLHFGSLFYGFKHNFDQLLLLGLSIILIIMVTIGVMVGTTLLVIGSGFNSLSGVPSSFFGISPILVLLMVLFAIAISIPLMMFYWFAPALICINGLSVIQAMKLSFRGCLKNIIPFFLYGLVFMGIGLVLIIIFGALFAALTAILEKDSFIVLVVAPIIAMFLLWVSILPVTFASNYSAYKDIFYKN